MRNRLQRQIATDLAWVLGALTVSGIALGGTLFRLDEQRRGVDLQRSELAAKRARLTDEISAHGRLTDLAVARARLGEADALVADEASRISLISSLAQSSNMELVSVRSGTERPTTDAAVVTERHELVALGDYRDVAKFIDALLAAQGSVAIDALKLTRGKVAAAGGVDRYGARSAAPLPLKNESTDTRLRVSLEVIWLGVSPDFETLHGEGS